MRCRTCDHALWRTVGRTCPECGTSFTPSEFRFKPSTVAFRCPHCEQDYYGTDANGLLEPREFDCVRCGNHVRLDEMVLEPAAGRTEDQTVPRPNAWGERDRIGLWKAWWRGTTAILFRPFEFGDTLPPSAGAGSAFRYLLLCSIPVLALGLAFTALLFLPAGGFAGVAPVFGPQLGIGLAMFLGMLSFATIGAAIAHGTLVLLGGVTAPISRSIGCSFFAHGATSMIGLVPCVNCIPLVIPIWWFSSFRLMLAGVHGCGRGKATLAALVPLLLMGTVSIAAVAMPFLVTSGITTRMVVQAQRAQGVALASMQRQDLGAAMRQFELDADRPCATPLELLIDRPDLSVSLAELISPDRSDAASIGGRAIRSGLSTAEDARAAHESLLARLPAGPYRLGNLVLVPRGHPLEGQFGVRDPLAGDVWITLDQGVTESIVFPPGIDFDALPDLLDPSPAP